MKTSIAWIGVAAACAALVSFAAAPAHPAPEYDKVAAHYSSTESPTGFKEFCEKHGNPEPNTCAVRMSAALKGADAAFFTGTAASALKWKGLITRADHLAVHIGKRIGAAKKVAKPEDISGRKGIVFFDKLAGYAGSGHISMWNGSEVVDQPDNDYWSRADHVWFWALP